MIDLACSLSGCHEPRDDDSPYCSYHNLEAEK